MDEFYSETDVPEIEPEIEPVYNRHYITVDGRSRVLFGWSDGPNQNLDTTGAICINEQGGYQFRLFRDGEENPMLYTEDAIPLYKWDGERVVRRGDEEIAADRAAVPAPPPSELERLRADVDFLAVMEGVSL